MSLYIREKLLEYHKEYYQNNKTKLKEYANEYYQENKDKISQKFKSRKFVCPCGKELGYYWRVQHYDSKKHNTRIMMKLYLKKWYRLTSHRAPSHT